MRLELTKIVAMANKREEETEKQLETIVSNCDAKNADMEVKVEAVSKKVTEIATDCEKVLGRVTGFMASTNEVVEKITTTQTEVKIRLDQIDRSFARLKEETDTLDNDRLRDTIIAKKVQTEEKIPNDSKAILELIRGLTKQMIEDVLGREARTKYIGLAFPIDPTKMKLGNKEVPPFKFQFRAREDSLEFKSKAVDMAKKPNGKYSGAYFTFPQNAATRIRVQVLWAIAKNLKNDTTESWVSQGTTRPSLMFKPENLKYPRALSYVQAVTEFGDKVPRQELVAPANLANRFFRGEVERIFIILEDTK